jgi:hypothetical protein
MKNLLLILFFGLTSRYSIAQTKNFIDMPYLETAVTVDTMVTPDKIYLSIILNEEDQRNKKSTEELETAMLKVLRSLSIDIEKDLTLLDASSDFKKYFLSGQKVLKTKVFSLILNDATTVGKAMAGLEQEEISNVAITKTEYSKSEELILLLKAKAIVKAHLNARNMVAPLNQKVGKLIYVSDLPSSANVSLMRGQPGATSIIKIRGVSSMNGNIEKDKMLIDFEKRKFSVQLEVKFSIE